MLHAVVSEELRTFLSKLIATAVLGMLALSLLGSTWQYAHAGYDPLVEKSEIGLLANFNADGEVELQWNPLPVEGFEYYKIVRSTSNPSLSYPEDGYIFYSEDQKIRSYIDREVPEGKVYYRLCIIAGLQRYCSNVVAIRDELIIPAHEQVVFHDTRGHWAEGYAALLALKCGVTGYKDSSGTPLGLFKPQEPISRAELMKLLSDCASSMKPEEGESFVDVEKGSWYEASVIRAKRLGWVEGYPDGTFRPYTLLNRAEALSMILKTKYVAKEWAGNPSKVFHDVSPESWYGGLVSFALEKKIISMSSEQTFRPGDAITRGESAKIMVHTYGWESQIKDIPVVESTGEAPRVSSTCQIFPDNNPWNQEVTGFPVHKNSEEYIASILKGRTFLHPDFGSNPEYGIPYVLVNNTQKKVPVKAVAYPEESDSGDYPIPDAAPIEAGGDHHVLVVDTDSCMLYELYRAVKTSWGWEGDSVARFDLTSNALRPDYWTSADAAGLPIYPGLVKYEEVQSGALNHALRFTVSKTQRAFIHPATHFASSRTESSLPPMGLRLRLKESFDLTPYSGSARVILEALKKYGMIVADNGSDWFISGATDTRWNDEELEQLKTVPGSAFEALETGEIVYEE